MILLGLDYYRNRNSDSYNKPVNDESIDNLEYNNWGDDFMMQVREEQFEYVCHYYALLSKSCPLYSINPFKFPR